MYGRNKGFTSQDGKAARQGLTEWAESSPVLRMMPIGGARAHNPRVTHMVQIHGPLRRDAPGGFYPCSGALGLILAGLIGDPLPVPAGVVGHPVSRHVQGTGRFHKPNRMRIKTARRDPSFAGIDRYGDGRDCRSRVITTTSVRF